MSHVVRQYENYGKTKAPEQINDFLQANRGSTVVSITPTRIDFEGGQVGGGVMVVFEVPNADRS